MTSTRCDSTCRRAGDAELAARGVDGRAGEAGAVARHPGSLSVTRIVALQVIGLIQVRRGEGDEAVLNEVLELAERTGELQRSVRYGRRERRRPAWPATLPAPSPRHGRCSTTRSAGVTPGWSANSP